MPVLTKDIGKSMLKSLNTDPEWLSLFPKSRQQMLSRISGRSCDYIIIDDPLNEDNMKTATESAYGHTVLGYHGTALAQRKPAKVNYNTVGVRFLDGHNIAKVYTYGVRKGGKIHLGQELVADTQRGPALVAVVRIDKTPAPVDPSWPCGLKFLTRKVVAL